MTMESGEKTMTLKLRAGVSTAETEYGIALLDEDRGEYWNLNPTGAMVLRTLLDGGTSARAAEELVERYAVLADTATRDVEELIGELRSAGLVEQEDPSRLAPTRSKP